MAAKLAKQLGLPELSNADCDWIVSAANRAIMVSENDAGPVIGYLLGLAGATYSISSLEDQVQRAIDNDIRGDDDWLR